MECFASLRGVESECDAVFRFSARGLHAESAWQAEPLVARNSMSRASLDFQCEGVFHCAALLET
jgi:hypothetical protein